MIAKISLNYALAKYREKGRKSAKNLNQVFATGSVQPYRESDANI